MDAVAAYQEFLNATRAEGVTTYPGVRPRQHKWQRLTQQAKDLLDGEQLLLVVLARCFYEISFCAHTA